MFLTSDTIFFFQMLIRKDTGQMPQTVVCRFPSEERRRKDKYGGKSEASKRGWTGTVLGVFAGRHPPGCRQGCMDLISHLLISENPV